MSGLIVRLKRDSLTALTRVIIPAGTEGRVLDYGGQQYCGGGMLMVDFGMLTVQMVPVGAVEFVGVRSGVESPA